MTSVQDLIDRHDGSQRALAAAVNAHQANVERLRDSLEKTGPLLTDDGTFVETLAGELRILKPGRTTATPAPLEAGPHGLPGPAAVPGAS